MNNRRNKIYPYLLVAAAVAALFILLNHRPERAAKGPVKTPPARQARRPAPSMRPRPAAPKARVAIIIDDLGQDIDALRGVLELPAPVAVSVLPGLVHSEDCARRARAAGREVLLHLPMEAKDGNRLGPGGLVGGMDAGEVEETVRRDLESVPGAAGVNNHMGSALTGDKAAMRAVMEALKGRGLFFVDSRTSPGSVAYETATGLGIRAGSRAVFLDDSDAPAQIRKQLGRLSRIALRKGKAIAIGHPRPATLAALRDELPVLRDKGIAVVRVSELLDRTEGTK